MKFSVELGGPLLLLVSLIWVCSGQEPVLVECSHFNFGAMAKRTLFYKDELVGPVNNFWELDVWQFKCNQMNLNLIILSIWN